MSSTILLQRIPLCVPQIKQGIATFALLLAVLVVLPATRLVAQAAGTATIQGVVQDASGADISGATVTAINVGTNSTSVQKTSSHGTYVLTALTPGLYNVSVDLQGFKPYLQQHVTLDALSQLGLNIVRYRHGGPEGCS